MLTSLYVSCSFVLWLSPVLFFRKAKSKTVGLENIIMFNAREGSRAQTSF